MTLGSLKVTLGEANGSPPIPGIPAPPIYPAPPRAAARPPRPPEPRGPGRHPSDTHEFTPGRDRRTLAPSPVGPGRCRGLRRRTPEPLARGAARERRRARGAAEHRPRGPLGGGRRGSREIRGTADRDSRPGHCRTRPENRGGSPAIGPSVLSRETPPLSPRARAPRGRTDRRPARRPRAAPSYGRGTRPCGARPCGARPCSAAVQRGRAAGREGRHPCARPSRGGRYPFLTWPHKYAADAARDAGR